MPEDVELFVPAVCKQLVRWYCPNCSRYHRWDGDLGVSFIHTCECGVQVMGIIGQPRVRKVRDSWPEL